MKNGICFAVLSGILFLLAGCGSSYHARDMQLRTTLVNPAILTKGTGDQALYRYLNKDVDMQQYTKILLDPVMIAKDGQMDAETHDNFQRLANNAYSFMIRELNKDYAMVKEPGKGTVRIQMVILDADPSSPMRNVISSITPIGMAVNLVTYSASGQQSGVGDISMEMKVTDSETGLLLGALVDKRVGGENLDSVTDAWSGANAGLEWWAKRTRYILCMAKSPVGCVKP